MYYDDLNRYIFSLAFFSFKRKASDCFVMSYSADHPDRLDTRGYMGGTIAAEFKSGQKECQAY